MNLFVLPSHLQALNGQQSDSKEKEREAPEEKEEEEEDEEEDDSSDPDIEEEIQASQEQAGPGKKCINHLHLLPSCSFSLSCRENLFLLC